MLFLYQNPLVREVVPVVGKAVHGTKLIKQF